MDPQLKYFFQAGAEARQALYSETVEYIRGGDELPIPVEINRTSISSSRELREGFQYEHQAVFRILKSKIEFVPQLGDIIRVQGYAPLRVNELAPGVQNPEYRVGVSGDV